MRLDSKRLHPSLVRAVQATLWSGGGGRNPKYVSAYQSQWFREHGTKFVAIALVAVAAFVFLVLSVRTLGLDRAHRVLALLLLIVGFPIAMLTLALRQSRSLSTDQLGTLLPALDLSETQRAYAETLVALGRLQHASPDVDETILALNALIDEENRLIAFREAVVGSEAGDILDRLRDERTTLAQKVGSALDAEAREAYVQSLALLDDRIEGVRAAEVGVERIDAHLELLRQAVLATRDASNRRSASPRVEVDFATDALRASVAMARAQTTATERALCELRSL